MFINTADLKVKFSFCLKAIYCLAAGRLRRGSLFKASQASLCRTGAIAEFPRDLKPCGFIPYRAANQTAQLRLVVFSHLTRYR
jgi:hypothetical protein